MWQLHTPEYAKVVFWQKFTLPLHFPLFCLLGLTERISQTSFCMMNPFHRLPGGWVLPSCDRQNTELGETRPRLPGWCFPCLTASVHGVKKKKTSSSLRKVRSGFRFHISHCLWRLGQLIKFNYVSSSALSLTITNTKHLLYSKYIYDSGIFFYN